MIFLIIIASAFGIELIYKFKSSAGQVIYDYSTYKNHAVVGYSVLPEPQDALLTNRGIFISDSTLITLPPNSLLPSIKSQLSMYESIKILFYPISKGCVFSMTSKNLPPVKFCIAPGTLGYYNENKEFTTIFSDIPNESWILLNFRLKKKENSFSAVIDIITQGAKDSNYLELENFSPDSTEILVFSKTSALISEFSNSQEKENFYNTQSNSISYTSETFYELSLNLCPSHCFDLCFGFPFADCFDEDELCSPGIYSSGACFEKIENCLVQQSKKCKKCEEGFLLGEGESFCFKVHGNMKIVCDSDCLTCSGTTDDDCITCYDPYATAEPDQPCKCIDNYNKYSSDPLECTYEDCDPVCHHCTGPDSTDCIDCEDKYSEVDSTGTCVCNVGYYRKGTSRLDCTACNEECLTCFGNDEDMCITCVDSNAIVSATTSLCVCSDGYYQSAVSPLSCSLCYANCATCSGPLINNCLTCKVNMSLTALNTCVCNTGYVINAGVCQACDLDCYDCTGFTKFDCITCSDSHASIVSGQCQCNIGYYSQITSPLICSLCHLDCKQCNGGTEFDCTICNDSNALVVSGQCTCNLGYYSFATNPLICVACDSDCFQCTGSTNLQCIVCSDSNASVVSSLCTCNLGFYTQSVNPLVCSPCHYECSQCIGGTNLQCTVCSDSNASIVSSLCICNLGFYKESVNSSVCSPCHLECSQCIGGSNLQCTVCSDSNAYAVSGACTCKIGFFIQSNSPLFCGSCHTDCYECTGLSNLDCISCIHPNAHIVSNQCTCMPGYFNQSSNPLECKLCYSDCKECTGSTNLDCISCKDANSQLVSRKCTCIQGYFSENENPLNCSQCHSDCMSCKGNSSFDCTSCSDPNSYLTKINSCECIKNYYKVVSGKCKKCGDGFYIQDSLCLACNSTCSTCLNNTHCTDCVDIAMILNNGNCECDQNFSKYNEDTQECECLDGLFKVNNQCEICQIGCAKCTNNLNCTVPSSGYYINNGIPEKCHSDCKECLGGQNTNCLECFNDQILVNGLCECPIGSYRNELNCIDCIYKCINCTSSTNCNECEKNYIFDYNTFECILDQNSTDILSSSVSILTSLVGYLGIITSIASASFSNNPSFVWTTINTVQLLCYIPLQNIEIPNKLYVFFRGLQPISLIINILKVYNLYDCESEGLNSKFVKYGYKCKYFITNIGEVLLAFGLSILYLILVYVLYLVTCSKVKYFLAKKLKEYKWSYIVRFWIEGYLDIAIPCIITLNNVRNI